MSTVGTVESLWRYPVKSMRGEELEEMFVSFAGVYGDRIFGFRSSASPEGFPHLTAREQRQMLRYRPRFRQPAKTIAPPNWTAAEKIGTGVTPIFADREDLMVDVQTPAGNTLAIDDPALIELLREGLEDEHRITLHRSEHALTDCRPVSLIALQSVEQLTTETSIPVDKRRFRANIYLDLKSAESFGENAYVGRSLRVGPKVTIAVLQRDGRCMVITLDPETGEKEPAVLKAVAQAHEGMAGIYGAVLVEGMVRKGDAVELLD